MRDSNPAITSVEADAGYRADLDGLRGYAVVIAVLFHYGLAVPGGFIGPEIFFVISGYLIGGIVLRAIDSGRFSFARFLEFRIRRVAPAALAVIIPCLIAGYLILLPRKLERLAESALANLYFGANHLLLSQGGYFDAASEFKPLLHTWSLSVEEQFYFVFPILALFLTRLVGGGRRSLLVVLAICLFAVNLWLTRQQPQAAYFMAIGRSWEFLCGVLLVLWPAPRWSQTARNIVSLSALVVLVACAAFYDRHMAYPGFAVLLPVLATGTIIRVGMGGQPLVNRLIGMGPQRLVGLISYSFYMWHWPVFVFMQHLVLEPVSQAIRWATFFVVLGIAVLSWRFIEEPFRARAGMSRQRLYTWIGGGALIVLAMSLAITTNKGLPMRWQADPALVQIEKDYYRADACYLDIGGAIETRDPERCRLGDLSNPQVQSRVLLWGDSHARQWLSAVDRSARDHAVSVVVSAAAACPPVLDFDPADRPGCAASNRRLMAWLFSRPDVRTIMLAARWSRYEYDPSLAKKMAATLAVLKAAGREVILVGMIPSYHKPVPVMLALLDWQRGLLSDVQLPVSYSFQEQDQQGFERLFLSSGLPVLDPWPLLCNAAGCSIRREGRPLYLDETHLSDAAANGLSHLFDPVFEAARSSR